MHSTQSHNRIFGLDILRACAIISLLATHGGFLVSGTFLDQFPYLIFLDGVDLFFTLSGFLIGTILLKEISQDKEFTISNLGNFWKRRWFRTLPSYYLVLLLNYVFIKLHFVSGTTDGFSWKYLFFIHNFTSAYDGPFMESWSLSVEEWFYIIAPIILYLLLKKLKPNTAFITTLLILILVSIVARYLMSDPLADESYGNSQIRPVVIARLDAIGYGLFAAWVSFYYQDFWRKYKIHSFILCLVLHYFIMHFNGNYIWTQIVGASLVPLSYMFILPLATSIKTGKGFIAKGITHVSKVSYSMYLINSGLTACVIRLHFPVKNETDGMIKFFIYYALIIFVSTVIYKFYEKPIMDLRDRSIRKTKTDHI